MKSRVEDLMTRRPKTCRANEALNGVAKLMWEHDMGCVPVVNDRGRLVGMVTDRDICMAAYTSGRALDAITTFTAMSCNPVWVRSDDGIEVALEKMRHAQVRRLPVIDAEWNVVGLISMCDLIRDSGSTDIAGGVVDRAVIETLQSIGRSHIARELAPKPKMFPMAVS